MDERARTGRVGEEQACRYLVGLGHTVIARNRRENHLEIDIVSVAGDGSVHFVEVKCRRAPAVADPQDNVGPAKQRRLVSAANKFLHSPVWKSSPYSLGDPEIFFDVVSVLLFADGHSEIEYFPAAFWPLYV